MSQIGSYAPSHEGLVGRGRANFGWIRPWEGTFYPKFTPYPGSPGTPGPDTLALTPPRP